MTTLITYFCGSYFIPEIQNDFYFKFKKLYQPKNLPCIFLTFLTELDPSKSTTDKLRTGLSNSSSEVSSGRKHVSWWGRNVGALHNSSLWPPSGAINSE